MPLELIGRIAAFRLKDVQESDAKWTWRRKEKGVRKFMALYIGSLSATEKAEHLAGLKDERVVSGMEAWGQWMTSRADVIVDSGSPLGRTFRVSKDGIEDYENRIVGYIIVEAATHDDAARLFENHPHFKILPGDSVEVMELLPIPGAS